MQLLIKLYRFEKDLAKLKKEISKFGENVSFEEEKSFLCANGDNLDYEKINNLIEVESVLIVIASWEVFSFVTLQQAAVDGLAKIEAKKYKVFVNLNNILDLSSKSIYKKINASTQEYTYSEEEYDTSVLVEVVRRGDKKYFRLSVGKKKEVVSSKRFEFPFLIILENPLSVGEVADFMRVCWVFKVPLMLLGEIDASIVDKAKKETKNIPREFVVLTGKNIPRDYIVFGFSKLGECGEEELISSFEKRGKKEIALLFGNEKFGLSQKAREECKALYRLGYEPNKPLRGCQALSYVLGLFRGLK